MSADPRDALADLLVDLQAVLEDSAARGMVFEGPSEPLPAPPAPEPVHGKAWSSLASKAREAAETELAAGDVGLRSVREDLGDCRRCRLCTDRTNLVFGQGTASADLLIIGPAPGRAEDYAGQPFAGPQGEMLDKMLENVLGLRRDQVYLTTAVKCRPPGDRLPELDELRACHPFWVRQLRAVQPKLILALGEAAFQMLFRTNEPLEPVRGQWRNYGGTPLLPTFHPVTLRERPDLKRGVFEDLKNLRAKYDEVGGLR